VGVRTLQAQDLIRVEYGGVRVLDLPALRQHVVNGTEKRLSRRERR
jgi:ribosomal protein S12